jgi:hypothetical protein
MAKIAGIKTLKNTKGEITHVTINVKKHKQIITPVLEELGVIEKSELQKMLESDEWITVEELRESALKHIDELWSK